MIFHDWPKFICLSRNKLLLVPLRNPSSLTLSALRDILRRMNAQCSQTLPVAELEAQIGKKPADLDKTPGFVLLESTLTAHNRGTNSFLAHSPVRSLRIEPEEPIPPNWKALLVEFLRDRSAFYTLFLSYEFGVEVLLGESTPVAQNGSAPKLVCHAYESVVEEFQFGSGLVNPPEPAFVRRRPNSQNYLSDIERVKNHIFEGDIYQANYTGSWCVTSASDPRDVYNRLRELNPAQYSAFAQVGTEEKPQTIISSSPERLFRIDGNIITANPIKGTIARGATAEEIARNRDRLLTSEKDRAELLMIVDLLRNDLGKICVPGSVVTPAIWRAEEFSSVIHLVGEITGHLRDDVTIADALEATFPGGSITGAPKRRAVELLCEIEQRPRGWYTGSFGYIFGDIAEFNIAIRTITHSDDCYDIQAGGGIVADSDPEGELAEAKLKARNLLKAVNPLLEP